jgi:hypothetical protein
MFGFLKEGNNNGGSLYLICQNKKNEIVSGSYAIY